MIYISELKHENKHDLYSDWQGLMTCFLSLLVTAEDIFKARPSLASPSPEDLPVSGAGPAWGLKEPLPSTGGGRMEPDCKYSHV